MGYFCAVASLHQSSHTRVRGAVISKDGNVASPLGTSALFRNGTGDTSGAGEGFEILALLFLVVKYGQLLTLSSHKNWDESPSHRVAKK